MSKNSARTLPNRSQQVATERHQLHIEKNASACKRNCPGHLKKRLDGLRIQGLEKRTPVIRSENLRD
jgi:hypothetical protein